MREEGEKIKERRVHTRKFKSQVVDRLKKDEFI